MTTIQRSAAGLTLLASRPPSRAPAIIITGPQTANAATNRISLHYFSGLMVFELLFG